MNYDLTCLAAAVGVQGVTTSEYGVYINDLAGISRTRAAQATEISEQATGNDLLQECINNAAGLIADEVGGFLQPQYTTATTLAAKIIGKEEPSSYTAATAVTNQGIKVSLLGGRRDAMGLIYINRVKIMQNSISGDVDVTITDGQTSKIVTVTLEPGVSAWADVQYQSAALSVTITYDTVIGEQYGNNSLNANYCGCARGTSGMLQYTGYRDGVEQGDNAFGMTVDASITCDESRMLCALRMRLAYILQFKAGYLLLQEALYSNRTNPYVTLSKEGIRELSEQYDSEYKKRMEIFKQNSRTHLESLRSKCITCTGNRYSETY